MAKSKEKLQGLVRNVTNDDHFMIFRHEFRSHVHMTSWSFNINTFKQETCFVFLPHFGVLTINIIVNLRPLEKTVLSKET